MAFERISAPSSGYGTGVAPWNEDPRHGSLDSDDAIALAEFLANFTDIPQQCFFAVWEGYGQFNPGAMSVLSESGAEPQVPPAEVLTAERLTGVGRDYILYAGPLSAVISFFPTSGMTRRTSGGQRIESGASRRISIWTPATWVGMKPVSKLSLTTPCSRRCRPR